MITRSDGLKSGRAAALKPRAEGGMAASPQAAVLHPGDGGYLRAPPDCNIQYAESGYPLRRVGSVSPPGMTQGIRHPGNKYPLFFQKFSVIGYCTMNRALVYFSSCGLRMMPVRRVWTTSRTPSSTVISALNPSSRRIFRMRWRCRECHPQKSDPYM